MNYTVPPGVEDLEVLATSVFETLPDEILRFCENPLEILVEDVVDETIEADLDLDDPYDLLALYRSGKQISPGVERKVASDEDCFILYRRPVLDMWCETEEDLFLLIRQVMIEELGRHFDFSEDEVQEMTGRHYQGML